jgi:hypothetical protein
VFAAGTYASPTLWTSYDTVKFVPWTRSPEMTRERMTKAPSLRLSADAPATSTASTQAQRHATVRAMSLAPDRCSREEGCLAVHEGARRESSGRADRGACCRLTL